MNTTIREIVKLVEWNDVERAIKYFYPDDKNKYKPVFEKLKTIRARKHKNPKEFIEMNAYFEDGLGYYHVATNEYSMSFRKWAELANIPIAEDVLKHMTFEAIVAHFIWEITFYGTEADSKKVIKEGKKRLKEMKKEIGLMKKANKKLR